MQPFTGCAVHFLSVAYGLKLYLPALFQNHIREQRVRPRKPRTGIHRVVVLVHRFMDIARAARATNQHFDTFADFLLVVRRQRTDIHLFFRFICSQRFPFRDVSFLKLKEFFGAAERLFQHQPLNRRKVFVRQPDVLF